jgi:DNA-binding winged helix-turn-helix (wHTH) protein/tetratricopeptide (TPR) repeat protein/energy-coupling factor transporter ATP-binding protein EcfA2
MMSVAMEGGRLSNGGVVDAARFRLGDWLVAADENLLLRGKERIPLQPKVMQVLAYLAEHCGQVVSAEQLLIDCWRGAFHGDNPVHKTVAVLRKALDDDPMHPRYIQTIRKRGYRMLVPVSFPEGYSRTVAKPVAAWSDGCPFRGLEAFGEQHAAVFFGRNRTIAQFLQLLRGQIEQACAFVLVVGASGSGKSSLIQAGVLPLLKQPGGFDGLQIEWSITINPAHGDVLARLANALLRSTCRGRAVFVDAEIQQLLTDPAGAIDKAIARLRDKLDGHSAGVTLPRAAVVVDPLESLLSNSEIDREAREAFILALFKIAQSGVAAVVAACRSDMYARLSELASLVELKREAGGHFDLFPPTAGEIAEMIRLPARAAGLSFGCDSKTGTRLDDDLRDSAACNPDALPLLQHVLRELYERRAVNGELLYSAYEEIGGLGGALSRHAEDMLQSLPTGIAATLPSLLGRMVSINEDGTIASRTIAVGTLRSASEQQLVQAFIDARLFIGRGEHIDAAHEALWRSWPRAGEWIDSNRAHLLAHSRLTTHVGRWEQSGRSADLLLADGLPLYEARSIQQEPNLQLSPSESTLIALSIERSRIRQRRKVMVLGSLVGLSLLAGSSGIYAWQSRLEAERDRASAEGLVAFMLGDLMANLRPLGKLDLLDRISEEVLHYLRESADVRGTLTRQLQRIEALNQIGAIETERGNADQATRAYEQADHALRRLVSRHPKDPKLLAKLGSVHFGLGNLAYERDELAVALSHFERYRTAAWQLLQQEPSSSAWRLELSYAYNNVGSVELRRRNGREAAGAFAQSIELKRHVLRDDPSNPRIKADVANALTWLATALEASGDLESAAKHYAEALQLATQATESDAQDATLLYREAVARMRVADLQIALAQIEAARTQYATVERLLQQLVTTEPENRNWLRALLYARVQRASLLLFGAETSEALLLLTRTQANIVREFDAGSPDPSWSRLRASALIVLGHAYGLDGDRRLALGATERAISELRALLARDRADVDIRNLLARALASYGELLQDGGQLAAARDVWHQIIDLQGINTSAAADKRVLDPLARALINLDRFEEAAPLLSRLDAMGYAEPSFSRRYTLRHTTRRASR